jgi:hypothetical protein
MANKKRRCSQCKTYKIAADGIDINGSFFCDINCATTKAFNNRDKGRKIKNTANKKELKDNDKSYRAKQAQAAFNAYIRLRDIDDPCISCQRFHAGQYHAGHYRSVGAHPELRFEELNNNKQCAPCNNHLSGNITDYRINLIKKIGLEKVEWIEGKHEPKKYTCKELKEIELKYKQKLKELKWQRLIV